MSAAWVPTASLFLNGAWVAPAKGQTPMLVDPSDGSDLAPIPRSSAEDIDRAVAAARTLMEGEWGGVTAL